MLFLTLLSVPSPSVSARLNILMAPAATIWFSRLRALAAAVRPFRLKGKRIDRIDEYSITSIEMTPHVS